MGWREEGKKEEVCRWAKTQIQLSQGVSPSSWPKAVLGAAGEGERAPCAGGGGGGMLVLEQPAPRGRQLLAIYSVRREVPGRGFKSR